MNEEYLKKSDVLGMIRKVSPVELRPRPLRMLEKMIREAKGETETPAEAPAPGAHAEEDLKKMTKGQLIELVKNQDGDIARLHQHYGEACMKAGIGIMDPHVTTGK